MELIDFTEEINNAQLFTLNKKKKIIIYYNNQYYLIKFSKLHVEKSMMLYTNNIISEYIGCKIYESIGISTQKVLLGYYNINKEKKIKVIACEIFTNNNLILKDFGNMIEKQEINSKGKNYQNFTLENIIEIINNQNFFDKEQLLEHFWNMFIIDAFIGNSDRGPGNWGFLNNIILNETILAPIYDCENSCFPNKKNKSIKEILKNKDIINYYALQFFKPSYMKFNNKPINYFNFITSLENEDCNAALKRIVPKINMDKICDIINDIPCITELQKEFYITMLKKRKELLLDFPLYMLKNR